jgi:hypothetical protein
MNLDFALAAREVAHAMPVILIVGGAVAFGAYRLYEAIRDQRALPSQRTDLDGPNPR